MSKPSPILNVLTLLSALENRPDGLTAAEVATALQLPTEDRVKPWLEKLVSDRWLIVTGGNRARRFALAAGVAADLPRLRAEQANVTPPPPAVTAGTADVSASRPPAQPAPAETAPPRAPGATPVAPPAVTPAAPPPPAAVTPAAHPVAASFESMYALAVLDIVAGGMDRESARYALRKQALRNDHDPASAAAYVAYATAQLDALTSAEADTLGISPAHYEAWRSRWAPVGNVEDRKSGKVENADRTAGVANPQSAVRNPQSPAAPAPAGPSLNSQPLTLNSAASPTRSAGQPIENREANTEAATPPTSAVENPFPPQSAGTIENRESKVDIRPPTGAPGVSPPPLRSGADPSDRPSPPVGSVENPPPPQSAVRNPQLPGASAPAPAGRTPPWMQSVGTLSTLANRTIDRFAPGLPPELRAVLVGGVVVLIASVVTIVATKITTTISTVATQHPWYSFGALLVLVVGVYQWAKRSPVAANHPPIKARPTPQSAIRSPQSADVTGSRRAWLMVGALAITAALIVGGAWYWRTPPRPGDAAIADYLARSAAPLPIRVIGVLPSYTAVTATGCTVAYQAALETTAPLYRRLDTTAYLRANAAPQLAAIEAAAALLRGPDGANLKSQISNFQSAAPAPVLVTTATPSGTVAPANGILVAWRREGVWAFSPQQGGFDPSQFPGEPKPAGALAVDDPADVARLNVWLADQVAYAAQVQTAAAAAAAERERNRPQPTTGADADPKPGTKNPGPTETRNPPAGSGTAGASAPAPIPQSENRTPPLPPPVVGPAPLPPFPTAAGAYVLADGRWVALPRRESEMLHIDDNRPRPADAAGLLIFFGPEDDPVLPAEGGALAWVGAKPWTAAQVKRYPALQLERFYPAVELTAVERDLSGNRCAWLRELLPGITGVGDTRVPATLEHPAANVTVLRPTVPLRPGHYGLVNATQYFEVVVE